MAEIVNLRRVRKQKARDDAAREAEANRRKFGLSKAERQLHELEEARAAKALESHKREE